jgi:nitrogen fixation protein NifX
MAIRRHLKIVDDGSDGLSTEESLKVAFATTDMKTVDQHFGSAQSFAIYAVDMDNQQLLEAAEFGKLEQDGNEDKLAAKISMLDGCAAVYCQAVGSSAARQLMAKGVQPVKVAEGSVIAELVKALQEELRQGPSAWLAKAIKSQMSPEAGKFDAMEAEGWDE